LENPITKFFDSQAVPRLESFQECRAIATWHSSRNDFQANLSFSKKRVGQGWLWLLEDKTMKKWLEKPGVISWCEGIREFCPIRLRKCPITNWRLAGAEKTVCS
jgi:hypothetical protein